ncbi:MAG: hypothetical protein HYZ45_08270, partial [Burkholderiales bacterium]|nr:hypothetical protein [Burkholderiales bacterium]
FGSNPLAMSGGDDAMNDARARRIARAKVRRAHACVTDADLVTAALAHPELQVIRAQMLPSDSPAVRTLLAVFVGEADGQSADFERARAALQAALQARCLLGTVLQVRGAQFIDISVAAELRIEAELDTSDVAAACSAALSAWLCPVPAPLFPRFARPPARARPNRLASIAAIHVATNGIAYARLWHRC